MLFGFPHRHVGFECWTPFGSEMTASCRGKSVPFDSSDPSADSTSVEFRHN